MPHSPIASQLHQLAAGAEESVSRVIVELAMGSNPKLNVQFSSCAAIVSRGNDATRIGKLDTAPGSKVRRRRTCVFFGEHTSIDAQKYLECAVQTDARVVREMMSDVK